MSSEPHAIARNVPEVVGDLDPQREVIRLGPESKVAHLPGAPVDICHYAHKEHGELVPAAVEFDDRPICRDCLRFERTVLNAKNG